MKKFDLFSDLLCSINQLLESGLTKDNICEVRTLINYSFNRFEKHEVSGINELGTIDSIAIKTLDTPKSLHGYFQVLTQFQNANEIHLGESLNQTIEGVQLMIGVFVILDELLALGITLCNAHLARLKLDSLFDLYEQDNKGEGEQFEGIEDLLTGLDDYIEIEHEKHPELKVQ